LKRGGKIVSRKLTVSQPCPRAPLEEHSTVSFKRIERSAVRARVGQFLDSVEAVQTRRESPQAGFLVVFQSFGFVQPLPGWNRPADHE